MNAIRILRAATGPGPTGVARLLPAAAAAAFKKPLRAVPYALLACSLLGGCAAVKPFEREKLTDPIMDPESPVGKQKLERKFYSTREGGAGGGTGSGGGCGCAK